MSWVAAAVIGSAVVGGVIASDASSNAADEQANAAANANKTQQDQFNQTRADNQPLLDTRNAALGQLNGLLANPSSVTQQPGYQFGMDQGVQSIDRSASSHGGVYSGATLKALSRYGQDYAGTKLNETYNRYANVAGLGQVATNSNTAAGMNTANQIGQNALGVGNVQAANSLNQGNIYGNALNGTSAYVARTDRNSPNALGNLFGNRSYLTDPSSYGAQNGSDVSTIEFSDARLKTNVIRVGTTDRGHNIYTWDWKTGGSGRGVIAQEVMHVPGAVTADHDGLLMVDYSKV